MVGLWATTMACGMSDQSCLRSANGVSARNKVKHGFVGYPNSVNQSQTVKMDAAVPIRTEDAATRFARPYMLAKM